jgi:hypothetical protein
MKGWIPAAEEVPKASRNSQIKWRNDDAIYDDGQAR